MIEECDILCDEPPVNPDLSHCTAATRNACKLCTPLGACLVYRGVRGAIPFLHGSQGCSTYIRRYLISHFREPMDIAASNFSEDTAVFGGAKNLETGMANVSRQYRPELIGLATTCLSETIGEDMPGLVAGCREKVANLPPVVQVSTASYRGSHIDGFHDCVTALVDQLAETTVPHGGLNLLPGMVSTADLRHLHELAECFGFAVTMLPDYSDTLDGATWVDYEALPAGGTGIEAIRAMAGARATLELGDSLRGKPRSAGSLLEQRFGVEKVGLTLPVGISATDDFLDALARISGKETPIDLTAERGRLVDSVVDAHKITFGKRAIVFGESDLVIGLVSFLCEIGVQPVLVACGGTTGNFETALRAAVPELPADVRIRDGADFADISHEAHQLAPDLLVGNSKGYGLARELGIPLIRTGFPIHDRIGGQRVLHLGYRGAQTLFDSIANALLEHKQATSTIGYSYL
ncbi:nitrogenase component 1 [Haloferula sargassicola]|uniref:Nitrogenase molybdenum-iron protein beta chain n=1 Tax=Haloferula sargassicola TaxID=490096 RepID=A0ABP9UKP5_9BACT